MSSTLWKIDSVSEWIGEWEKNYQENIKKLSTGKKSELLMLDEWMNKDLPSELSKRSPPYLGHEELAKIMKWKLMRGKFRPRLQQLVESNSKEVVKDVSSRSFSIVNQLLKSGEMEGSKIEPKLKNAVKLLADLKGVGPATASAILACFAPSLFPFMADEAILAVISSRPIKYDLKSYLVFLNLLREKSIDLAKNDERKEKLPPITPQLVSQCLWSEASNGLVLRKKISTVEKSKTSTKKRKHSETKEET